MIAQIRSGTARAALGFVTALTVILLAACSDGGETPTGVSFTHDPGPGDDPLVGHFNVCKVGTDADFNVTVDGATSLLSLTDGSCATVAQVFSSLPNQRAVVSVEEIIPANAELVSVSVKTCDGLNCSTTTGNNPTVARTLTNDNGIEVTFTNRLLQGGEGCTPGYWRQAHHFDSYPTGFAPSTPFIGATTGFTFDPALQGPESGNASDLTLLDALTLRGGGVNALIRQAAAAILNANSPDVGYSHSVSDVQDLYNIDMDKDALESANEAGCPLN